MAEEEETTNRTRPELPVGRVKKVMKLDKEVKKATSEALFLVSTSTELFLRFLAERSAEAALEKKRRTVKPEHLRIAVKRHRPTSDFLLDSLPVAAQTSDKSVTDKTRARQVSDKPNPAGTRRIDSFFTKSTNEAAIQINES